MAAQLRGNGDADDTGFGAGLRATALRAGDEGEQLQALAGCGRVEGGVPRATRRLRGR